MTVAADWYGELPVAFGCPQARPEMTLILSMVSLLHRECPRTIIETLVATKWWQISEGAIPADRTSVQFNAVMGWRFWFPMSTMVAARLSAKISALINQHSSTAAPTTPPSSAAVPNSSETGKFDISWVRAVQTIKTFHSISTILHGKMKVSIPPVDEMTFEVPNPAEGENSAFAFSGFRPIFSSDPADDEDYDDDGGSVGGARDSTSHALPNTHGLYAFLATVQAHTQIEDMRHRRWGLSTEQHMSKSIVNGKYDPPKWVKDRKLLHDISSLEPDALLTMCYPPASPPASAIGETLDQATSFVGAGTFGANWLAQAQPIHEVSTSLFDEHMVRVPVEKIDVALTTTPFDAVFATKFGSMWRRRLVNERLGPYYLKHFSFKTFVVERLLIDVKRMEATVVTSGWPDYTNILATELRALDSQIGGTGEDSRYAQQLDNGFAERMRRGRWADFSSALIARDANIYLRDLNLTATQAMIVEYCLAAFGRLPDLFTVAQVVVIVLLGDFGQGKSWCIETVQMLMPSGSQGTGSWVTETANAHLAKDVLAKFAASDEVYTEQHQANQMLNTAIATRLSGRQRLKRCPETNAWIEDLCEVLMDRALIIAGNDAPNDAIMNRAQPVFIGAHPGKRTAKQCAMAPGNESRRRAASLVMRRLYCNIYRNWHADNLSAIKLDNTIIRVVMSIYQTVMPEEYDGHSTRMFVAIRNLAMAKMKRRVTALWHHVVKHRGDDSDATMYQFYAHRNWVMPVDALGALFTTLKLCDSTKMQRDVSGTVQAMIKFVNDRPVSAENNPLYYETELHPDRMAEQLMARLPVGYGKSIIRWYLNNLTEKAGGGGNAVLVLGNGTVRVLKSYVLAAESQAVKAVWNTLLWIVANQSEYWGLDYDTEQLVVFNNATKHLLLENKKSAEFPEIPKPLANITPQACNRALQLLAEAGHAWWLDDHRHIFFSTSEEMAAASTTHFCAEIFNDFSGDKIIDSGGIERMYGTSDLTKKRTRLFGSALAVPLHVLEAKRDFDPTGASLCADRQKVIELTCKFCGGVRPGKIAWGMSNSSQSQFNESTVMGIDHGELTVDNPNQDLDAAEVLTAPLQTPHITSMERIFPTRYKSLRFSPAWEISNLVQNDISMNNTASPCPFEWSTWVTDNPAITLQVTHGQTQKRVYVPVFGDFTLKTVIRLQMRDLPDEFDVVGEVDGKPAFAHMDDVRKNRIRRNRVSIILQRGPPAAKRTRVDDDSF
ncbi:MAG: hypothetical protein CL678_01240 [Bdellovibrionaceae bacterium]|nr:hypothetical protein [Pseudobdellovibrionaceae bacterium]